MNLEVAACIGSRILLIEAGQARHARSSHFLALSAGAYCPTSWLVVVLDWPSLMLTVQMSQIFAHAEAKVADTKDLALKRASTMPSGTSAT